MTIGYDTPWRQVEAMLVEAAASDAGHPGRPAPRVFQTALSDFYPEYRLVCQAVPKRPRPRAAVLATLHANIQDVFNEYGVQIMSPHYLGDPATRRSFRPRAGTPRRRKCLTADGDTAEGRRQKAKGKRQKAGEGREQEGRPCPLHLCTLPPLPPLHPGARATIRAGR